MKICCFQCTDKAHGYNLDWVSFLWNRWLTLVHFMSNRNLCFSCPMDIFVSLVQWKTVFLSDQWISSHHSSVQWESLFLLTNGNLCDSCRMETFIFPVQWNLVFPVTASYWSWLCASLLLFWCCWPALPPDLCVVFWSASVFPPDLLSGLLWPAWIRMYK